MDTLTALEVFNLLRLLPVRFVELQARSAEDLDQLKDALHEAGWAVESEDDQLRVRAICPIPRDEAVSKAVIDTDVLT
jgi:hypothetical protein